MTSKQKIQKQMNRIPTIEQNEAPQNIAALYEAVKRKMGLVPNMIKTLAHSEAALQGYLGLRDALAAGVLAPKLREQIALAVAEINGCGYCLSAHTLLGGKVGLAADEILAARNSTAADSKSDAAIKLASAVTLQRGMIADSELQAARVAGLNDAEIIEVVQHVALNILKNYTNNVAQTVIDFPEVKPGKLEACTTEGYGCGN
jgi:uncharacterized peroxidase-related enzyme